MQELEVTNQVAMEVPDIGPQATCDHIHHAADALPAPPSGKTKHKSEVGIRTVYLSVKVMHEFMAFAKVRCSLT